MSRRHIVIYRVDILSIGVQVMRPSQLIVQGVDGRGLGLPVTHLGHVARGWHAAHHVAPGIGHVCLLLLSLPPPTENN